MCNIEPQGRVSRRRSSSKCHLHVILFFFFFFLYLFKFKAVVVAVAVQNRLFDSDDAIVAVYEVLAIGEEDESCQPYLHLLPLSTRSHVEVTLEKKWSESAFTMSRTLEDLRRARICLLRSEH
ncbi:hypothetical protein ACFX19_029955 [Malus domestica]